MKRVLLLLLLLAVGGGCGNSCPGEVCTSQIVVGVDPYTGKVVTPIVTTCVCPPEKGQ